MANLSSACSTGEEVEEINSYMSQCNNTTKYMLLEGKDSAVAALIFLYDCKEL